MDRLPDILKNHKQKFTDYVKCASTCSEDKLGLCQPQFVLCCKLLAKSITIQETFGAHTCQFSNSAYVNCNHFLYYWVYAVHANIDTFQDVSVHLFNWTIRNGVGCPKPAVNHCALNCMVAHCMILLSKTNFWLFHHMAKLWGFEFMKWTFACMVFTVSDALFEHKYRDISVTGLILLLFGCRPALSMLKSWRPFIVQSGMKQCTCRNSLPSLSLWDHIIQSVITLA